MLYVTEGRGAARLFSINGGLQEGYGPTGKVHDLSEVVATHHAWQKANGLILGGLVSANTVTYGWPQNGEIHSASEPGWKFEGGKNVLYEMDVSDEQFLDRLQSLASALAEALGQTRVYMHYAGEDFILQRPQASTPTGN